MAPGKTTREMVLGLENLGRGMADAYCNQIEGNHIHPRPVGTDQGWTGERDWLS
jgi:hypothetical protein